MEETKLHGRAAPTIVCCGNDQDVYIYRRLSGSIQRGLAQPNEPIFRLLLKIAVRYPHSQLPQLLEHSGVPPVKNQNVTGI